MSPDIGRKLRSMISEGAAFPDFTLQDQSGNSIALADLKGFKAVIYFYPKDDTSG